MRYVGIFRGLASSMAQAVATIWPSGPEKQLKSTTTGRSTVSKFNANYKLRAVSAAEIINRFGTAEDAMRATGGDEALALFFIHNPDAAPHTLRVRKVKSNLAKELKDEIDEIVNAKKAEKLNEQVRIAAAAYNETPEIKSIRKACKCKNIKAAELLGRAMALGLVRAANETPAIT